MDRAELERGQRQAERERTDHNESLLVAGVSAAFSAATTCSCGLGTAMISVVLLMLRNRQQGRVDYNVELVFQIVMHYRYVSKNDIEKPLLRRAQK
jgi:hypothetical protein